MTKEKLLKLIENKEVEDLTFYPRDIKFNDRIGKRYNKLLVLSLFKVIKYPTERVKVFWNCICDCGNETIKATDSLNRKGLLGTCSPSCVLKPTRPRTPETYFDGCLNSARARYRADASKRNYRFDLTKNQFKHLVLQPCFFCGESNTQHLTHKLSKTVFKFGGIDRIDNSIGYTVENCIPCCKVCNTLKNGITPGMVQKLYRLMVKKGMINE